MTCDHCCGADRLFDRKTAQKQLKRYRKKGLERSTKRLVSLLPNGKLEGKSLLDIGGGIGAIQWYFLENGGAQVTDVDASAGYIDVARDYATEKGVIEQCDFLHGDFVDAADSTLRYDYVTLDKVICCYPDYRALLGKATDQCNESISLTFPMGGPIARFFSRIGALYMKLKKNPFRSYVHDPQEVHQFIESRGFELADQTTFFPWLVKSYVRVNPV